MKKPWILSRDLKRILKGHMRKLLWVSVLLWFLFYLFNIFFWLNEKIDDINKIITDKVWIYFYINDWNQESTYNRIIEIKDQLWKKGIESDFSSKDDAFNFLEEKIPEITKNFDKFGIDNPLPSTLYVMFDNKKEYNDMKEIILANKDVILNIKDIDNWATLQQQENRSLRILQIANIIKICTYFILWVLAIIIITFTQHLLKSFFFDFYKELQTKKLLWATHRDTNLWFLVTLLGIMTLWFIIGFLLTCVTFNVLNYQLLQIWIDSWLCSVIPKTIFVFIAFTLIATALWYNKLYKLEDKF